MSWAHARLRQLLLLAAVGLGVSVTAFMDTLTRLASPTHILIYHLSGSPFAFFVPAIADTILLSAVCFTALLSARPGTSLYRALWSFALCLYPWLLVRNSSAVFDMPFPRLESYALLALCGAAFLFLALRRSNSADRAFFHVHSIGEAVLAAVGVIGALTLVEISILGVRARHLNDQVVADTITRPAQTAPHGRVVWILLDELAYRQLYGHRLAGLQLPAFDQFRAQSTDFSNVHPAGIRTEVVLPALMTGDSVDKIQSTASGALSIHDAAGWHSFDQQNTVFSDADAMGYHTSVVGWFNPYCRILPNVLDSCFWVNHSLLEGVSPDRGTVPNLLYPLHLLAKKLPSFLDIHKGLTAVDAEEGQEHIRDFVDLDRAADAALSDRRNDFLFLHMPVPHPGGIWDRHTGQFAVGHSCYVDNLVLADDYLAHVKTLLEASGQWDSTTVIIMGDHAWRTQLIWKGSPGWNDDDELASDGGRFDPRPAYLIKLPYQHTGVTVQTPFDAVRTRSLMDQLLQGRFANPAQLQQWVAGDPSSDSVAAQTPRAIPPHKGDHS